MSKVYETKHSKSQIALAIGSAIASGALTMPVQAAEPCSPVMMKYTVTSSAGDLSAGTLRSAIQSASESSDCDQIEFDPSISAITLSDATGISSDLNIVGPGKDLLSISNSNSSSSAISITSGDVHISGLKINNSGRGIYSGGATSDLTIDTVVIDNNSNGGIEANGINSLTIKNSEISNNGVTNNVVNGRGISFISSVVSASVAIEGSVISGNKQKSGSGGGLYVQMNDTASVAIKNSSFFSNEATTSGGGASIAGSNTHAAPLSVNIENSTFSGNTANTGGGISLSSGYSNGTLTAVLRQNTVSDNTASYLGGGVYVEGNSSLSQLRIESSTIANNTAASGGGGIYMSGNGSTISMDNTLVAKNTSSGGANLTGNFTTATYSWIGNNGGTPLVFSTASTNTTEEGDEATLLLGDLADNGGTTKTHLPLAGSPLIDAAQPNAIEGNAAGQVLSTDQRQAQRVAGSSLDIGAVETIVINVLRALPDNLITAVQNVAITSIDLNEYLSASAGTLTFSATGLPAGITLLDGVISGTPTVSGDFTIALTATDKDANATSYSVTATVTAATTGGSSSSSMGMILLGMLSGLLVWRRKQ